jgi:citrate lyase subunit beta/citryl-CoA lyase
VKIITVSEVIIYQYMAGNVAIAGNTGPKIRSDCEITLKLTKRGGFIIDLDSKVQTLYGESIKSLCIEELMYFNIKNAEVKIIDTGALPFVISARIEAAVRKLVDPGREFLPEMLSPNMHPGIRDRKRFSRLYLPGNNPGMMINAGLHSADGLILDLEDSVSPEKKDEARILVRNALRQVDFRGAEKIVRINQGERGLNDLRILIPHNVNLVIVPKCETKEQLIVVNKEIEDIRKKFKLKNPVFLMPVIESAIGVENAYDIARASGNVVAMAIGLEDFTADIGVHRSPGAMESFYARSRIIIAAKAAGIAPVDSVFSDVGDIEGLKQNVINSKALGFAGMGCIHPRQVAIINEGFSPDEEEIERARSIVLAFDEAKKRGLGVVALGTKMIDKPVVEKALKTIELAIRVGRLSDNWKNAK